jgi:hypothetical protein
MGDRVSRKISTTVYLTPEQDARLKQLNAITKVPTAERVRQGIDQVLEQYAAAGILRPAEATQ